MIFPTIDLNITDDVVPASSGLFSYVEKAIHKAVEVAEIDLKSGAELSVLLSGDEMIRELNREWRQLDKPTNVLSFPGEPDGFLLGDIIVSLDTTEREAALENKSFNDHFSHLIVHGFLHLFGYDHESDAEAEKMESLETKILSELGIADPYFDGSQT